MEFRLISTGRRLTLALLMTLALAGVQLVQGSALHDHPQHSVDCALCHFQLSDDAEFCAQPPLALEVARLTLVLAPPTRLCAPLLLPYQSRAPPLV